MSHRRLTDRMIRSLTPDLGRRVLHWDELQRGLGLVVHPTGRRVFKVVYQHGGRSRWFHIGDASIGIANARKIAGRILYEVAEGTRSAGAAAGRSARRDLRRTRRSLPSPSGRSGETSRGSRRTRSSAGTCCRAGATSVPRRSSRADVRGAIGAIKAPIVANQTLAAASAIFSWAVNQEIVPFNPVRGDRVEPDDESRPHPVGRRTRDPLAAASIRPQADPSDRSASGRGRPPAAPRHSSTASGTCPARRPRIGRARRTARDHRVAAERAGARVDRRTHRRTEAPPIPGPPAAALQPNTASSPFGRTIFDGPA